MMCPICSAQFDNPHPSNNVCRCGTVLNENGEIVKDRASFGKQVRASVAAPKSLEGRYDNVGNCLAELIPEWAVGSKKGCKCKDIQNKLNRWGTEGCEANIDWIVQKMKGQKKYLRGAMSKIPDSIAECGVRFLVKKAIKMSREK